MELASSLSNLIQPNALSMPVAVWSTMLRPLILARKSHAATAQLEKSNPDFYELVIFSFIFFVFPMVIFNWHIPEMLLS